MVSGQGIRKAAIFIDCLSPEVADKLLERLPQDYAQRIRDSWMTLGRISAEEQEQIIRDFLKCSLQKKGDTPESNNREPPSVPIPSPGKNQDPASSLEPKPFHGLRDAEADKLATILSGERPPTIALVLAHLPASQSGAVLVRLPRHLQIDVVRCLLNLEETDPDILREIDQALREKIAQLGSIQRHGVAGMSAITSMVTQCADVVGDQIVELLHTVAPEIAEQLAPVPELDFNQLIHFDSISLGTIFEYADVDLAVLALWGAPLGLVEQVLAELPSWKAGAIQMQLKELGPVRLRDVEEARRRIADLARQLAIQRKIRLPKEVRHHKVIDQEETSAKRSDSTMIPHFVSIVE